MEEQTTESDGNEIMEKWPALTLYRVTDAMGKDTATGVIGGYCALFAIIRLIGK